MGHLTPFRGRVKVDDLFWAHSGNDVPTESRVRLQARDRARKRLAAADDPESPRSPAKRVRGADTASDDAREDLKALREDIRALKAQMKAMERRLSALEEDEETD